MLTKSMLSLFISDVLIESLYQQNESNRKLFKAFGVELFSLLQNMRTK